MFQEEPRLAHQIGGPHHLKLARLDPIVQGSAGVDAQRQKSDKLRLHGADGLCRVDGVGLPVAVEPSHAVDGGDGDGDARRLAAQRIFHGLRRGDALVEFQEQFLIAAFQTDVDERQPVLTQLAQLLVRFALDGLGGSIGGDARTLGEVFADEVQHLQQIVHRQDQRVAVGEKDALDAPLVAARLGEVAQDLLHRTDGKLLILVHIAERTFVVAAAECTLHDQAVRLARRTVDGSVVVHGLPPCLFSLPAWPGTSS